MARMRILTTSEQHIFESPPLFNSVERKRYFSLPLTLNESMSTLTTPPNKVCFLASAGYFKARHRFFTRQFHQADNEKDKEILEKRTQIYELAKQKNPCGWSGKMRNWNRVEEVFLNTKRTNCKAA